MKNKLTYEFVKDYVEQNSTCELLSTNYINYDEKLKFRCECGNTFETSFDKFKNRYKRQCNNCGQRLNTDKKKLNFNYVKEFIENNSECILLSSEIDYKNNNSNLKFQCKCGNIFKASFANFKTHDKRRCNLCSQQNKINKLKSDILDINKIYIDKGYAPLFNEYINIGSKLPAIDNNGYKIFVSPLNLKNKNTNIFYVNNIYSYENMLRYVELNEPTYTLLSKEYKGTHKYYDFLCDNKHKYKTTWAEFLIGKRCPFCNISKGEKEIFKVLKRININFYQQYKFANCKLKLPLPFDFYIPNYNICIEYQGIQHYEPVIFFGGEKQFKLQQKLDQIKKNYCNNNNIKLIEIPYWDFDNIELILTKGLNLKVGGASA
jgi:Fe-S cluster assembly iron-binding protein IscA